MLDAQILSMAETNTTNTRVLVKDFGTRIVKLVLEYSLRSHEPAHMVHFPSGSDTMKAIEFDWHNFLSGTYVTVSGKTGLIAHLKVSKNVGFKYSECCSWPKVVVTHTKFSHILQQFLTFLVIH